MNTKTHVPFRIRTIVVALLVLGATGILPVHSQETPPGEQARRDPGFRARFGPVGLAPGQIVRLNLVNAEPPPDPDRPATKDSAGQIPPPCKFGLFLFDTAGHEVGKSEGILKSGESAMLRFTFDELIKGGIVGPDQTGRLELWAGVTFHPIVGPDRTVPPGPCIPTVEILDAATGKLTVLCPPGPPIRGLTPPGPPIRQLFGLVGLTRGETARLNLVQQPPGPPTLPAPENGALPAAIDEAPPGPPIDVELLFIDASGEVVLRQESKVSVGQGVSLDLPAELLVKNGQSQVRGVIRVIPPGPPEAPPGPCRGTLEIFDNATGRTSIFQLPAVQEPAARR